MLLKMSSATLRPFCLGFNVLNGRKNIQSWLYVVNGMRDKHTKIQSCRLHWTGRIITLTSFSSLLALDVVIMTTSNSARIERLSTWQRWLFSGIFHSACYQVMIVLKNGVEGSFRAWLFNPNKSMTWIQQEKTMGILSINIDITTSCHSKCHWL